MYTRNAMRYIQNQMERPTKLLNCLNKKKKNQNRRFIRTFYKGIRGLKAFQVFNYFGRNF